MSGDIGYTVHRQRPTPLMVAVQKQDVGAVKTRIEAGDDIEERDSYDQTALHWAAKSESAEIVQLLLDAGADANARDEDGDKPIQNAELNGHTATVGLLKSAQRRWFKRKR